MRNYEQNDCWNMLLEEDKLFITKGADETYFLDEAKAEQARRIYAAYCAHSLHMLTGNTKDRIILEKLERIGVIYQKKYTAGPQKKIRVSVQYFGHPNAALKNAIAQMLESRSDVLPATQAHSCDLLLLIRINVPLKNMLQDYEKITCPHLFIDLGYANTISIGPLVFKNETACFGCFIGRISQNWGDPPPPAVPDITQKHACISAFIAERIEEYVRRGNCPDLVNGVWSFHMNGFSTGHSKIYKLPWCPICNKVQRENPKMALPWQREVDDEPAKK